MQESEQRCVGVVILNWNRRDDTLACLRSLQQVDFPCEHFVVVADNGSADGSPEAIRREFPDVVRVENGANLGYAGGNNRGIERALALGSDLVWVLNNDTRVERNALVELLRALELHPDAGALASKTLFMDDPSRIMSAGNRWQGPQFEQLAYGVADGTPEFEQLRETAYAEGCSLLMTRPALEKAGLFDERFFLCWEDADWSYRVRQQGFRILIVPASRVLHRGSASFGGTESPLLTYFMLRNRLLFADTHLDREERRRVQKFTYWQLREKWQAKSRALGRCGALRDPEIRCRLLAVRDFLLRRFGNCPDSVRRLAKR